jgi:hypothetical protein
MPGGGFLAFVTYGSQNVLLSANPDMTFFYKVFRKYTHFAEESFTIAVDGPNELSWNNPVDIRAIIPRNADLVRDFYFVFTIPDIFSKFVPFPDRANQYEFAWSKYLGCRLIDSVELFIGGRSIQRFDGSYMVAKANLDMDADTLAKWEELVGHVSDLYDPANGSYAGGLTSQTIQGQYPTVVQNPDLGLGAQLNRPSIFGRDIYVPLPFYCTEDPSLSLPLCALQLQTVEIKMRLRPVRELYTINDASGYRVAPGFRMTASDAAFQRGLPTYAEDNTFNAVTNNYYISNFLVDIGSTPPSLEAINYNPRIYGTYIYLSDEERKTFATTQLTYLVHQVRELRYEAEFKRNYLLLDVHNPVTRIITVPRRSDAVPYRNDEFNWTNWVTDRTPFLGTPGVNGFNTSGLFLVAGQKDIIRSQKVICDGTDLQDDRTKQYLANVVPYRYYKGKNTTSSVPYPFNIKQSMVQPSGSINASRIKNFQLDNDVWPLPVNSTYVYDITIYIENLNWVIITSGTGDLKYAT